MLLSRTNKLGNIKKAEEWRAAFIKTEVFVDDHKLFTQWVLPLNKLGSGPSSSIQGRGRWYLVRRFSGWGGPSNTDRTSKSSSRAKDWKTSWILCWSSAVMVQVQLA